MEKMNSKEYWDNRFATDWKDYSGNEQTKFFATILGEMLPEWLIHEVNHNAYAICDLGCAEGDALPIYRSFFVTSEICGEDFSENAVEKASALYPEFSYKVGDILSPKQGEKYPVVICSNVVEHFVETYRAISCICERATEYAIIMIPYREEPGCISEHERVFHTKDIPIYVEDCRLVYTKSIACNSVYYPYEQLLLVYAKGNRFTMLSDIVENVCGDREQVTVKNLENSQNEVKVLLEESERNLTVKENELLECRKKLESTEARVVEEKELVLEDCERKLELKEAELSNVRCQLGEKELKIVDCERKLELKEAEVSDVRCQLEEKDLKIVDCEQKLELKEAELSNVRCQLEEKDLQIIDLKHRLEQTENLLDIKAMKAEELQEKIEQVEKEKQLIYADMKNEIECLQRKNTSSEEQIAYLTQEIARLQYNCSSAMTVLQQKNEYMAQAQDMCNHFATGKLMGLNHFMYRVKGQFFAGDKAAKKEFMSWFTGRVKKTNRSIGEGVRFNPWMITSEKLREGISCTPQLLSASSLMISSAETIQETVDSSLCSLALPESIKSILHQEYTKYDVIILSVIDYNFRHQRPQHFATRFANNGHRVFYVNANFIRPDSVYVQQDELYVVDFSCKDHNAIYTMNGTDTLKWMQEKFDQLIFSQAIRDAVVVVDYPNWVYGAEYIREKYGFKIVTDYMDDYTGFLGTAEDFLKNNCIRLLQKSDVIVSSSQFLYDVASQHTDANKIAIVRNGTEVEHFYQAIGMENPLKERKVIGYYGAVAHWFAWEKVCFLAKKFSECDIVIVGDVTEYRDKLEKYQNIKLFGEKPYKELPKYLADFDVCLIPFDTSTDLIKATNPVKFYEYLSAGKKVVATEIPELMPFRDEYVYMSNDDEKFAEYVKLCLDGTDGLKGKKECIEFARENDWQKRFEHFECACKEQIPMISVIVLTYNNLDYNRLCIESILKKTAYANYELIVVDNQSTDGTLEYLKELEQKEIPNVRIIFNDKNSGFAGGNNIGIRNAKGDYVLLLNNDTVVTRGWLTAMSKHLENNPRYGMCNPVTNSIGNESKIRVNYHNIQEMHEFSYSVTAEKMGIEYTDVDRLPLFATLIRKEVIDQVGMLDEAYKIGMFEDDDFTESVKGADYQIVIADDAFIHHINNGSFKKLNDTEYKRIFDANKAIFEKKWQKQWEMPKYREGVTADCNIHMSI